MKKIVSLAFVLVLLSTAGAGRFIRLVNADGTIYIRADGSVEGTDKIQRHRNVYTFTGNFANQSIVVEKDNIVVDGAGYSLQGIGTIDSKGIGLSDRRNVTIKNMKIEEFSYGIYLNHSANSSIKRNTLTAIDFECIRLYESSNNSIIENNIILNDIDGITLYGSSNNNITKNYLMNNYDGIRLYESSNNSITENTVKENYYGISLASSSDNNIASNNVTANHGTGISLDWSSNCDISGNTIKENKWDGILLSSSSNNSISGNNITANNDNGIQLYKSSDHNSITGNNVTNNSYGVELYESSNHNSIYGNNVTNNGYGIPLSYSSNYNSISGNSVTNNDGGVWLHWLSNYNNISGNNVTNNGYGIELYSSSNNIMYHNSFVDNTKQVDSYNSVNVWDDGYPSGGNYWSDYDGTDLLNGPYQNISGSDGIGDTLYDIDENNQDNYPLMGMFSDFNATSEYHVQTICNSAISDFQFNGTAISFNVSGEVGTTGFCRICIPTALMNDTYKVFVNSTEVPYTLLPCSNSTNSYLYFTYNHSTKEVTIIPEFPTWTSTLLILIMLTFTIAISKRRLLKTPIC